MMRSRWVIMLMAVGLSIAGCGTTGSSDESDSAEDGDTTSTSATENGSSVTFGSMDSPCGEAPDGATITVQADEAGGSADTLRVGVANERTATVRPGLLKEYYDAAIAFAGWCNAQGGIEGLEVEVVDLDGKVLEVEAAMATACTGTFALVGGTFAQDNLMFSGKDGSDFHRCGLIAIPGSAVSPEFAEANGVIQSIPNRAYLKPATWISDLVELYPEQMKKTVAVSGNIPSLVANKDQFYAVGKTVDGFGALDDISYDSLGTQDWNVTAQQVVASGATAVSFHGSTGPMATFSQKLKEQDWDGVLFADTLEYDQALIDSAGPGAVEGAIVRIVIHPLEEADRSPAIQDMIEMIDDYGPSDAKVASLSAFGISAHLLFAQSVKDCVADGETTITRDCVMKAASAISEWDAGGLHAASNPGKNIPPACSMLVQVHDGRWIRLHPELDSPADNGQGFSCADPGVVEITGDFGQGKIDPTRKY